MRAGGRAGPAVAAALIVLMTGVTPGVRAAPNDTPRFEVSDRDRQEAQREAERGARKEREGRARAALKRYLAALALDPSNETARAGLATLLGPLPGARTEPIRTTAPGYRLAEPYLPLVLKSAERHGVDPRLVLGVIQVESNFNPKARSRSGARGLMQLMPETARRFGVRSIEDPAQNIDAGTRYLRYLLDLFSGDVDRALAAYNAGEMTVFKAGAVPASPGVQGFVRDVKASSRQF